MRFDFIMFSIKKSKWAALQENTFSTEITPMIG